MPVVKSFTKDEAITKLASYLVFTRDTGVRVVKLQLAVLNQFTLDEQSEIVTEAIRLIGGALSGIGPEDVVV